MAHELTRFLLSWWFIFSALNAVQMVGPFKSEAQCKRGQDQLITWAKVSIRYSECFWVGGL
mgnify:CR=1 FL=1